jgi:hypothetical protein
MYVHTRFIVLIVWCIVSFKTAISLLILCPDVPLTIKNQMLISPTAIKFGYISNMRAPDI